MAEHEEKSLDDQQQELERLQARIYAAKMAYTHRTPFEDKSELEYDDLKRIAQEFIKASYAFQKKKYGAIKMKVSVAKLLRR